MYEYDTCIGLIFIRLIWFILFMNDQITEYLECLVQLYFIDAPAASAKAVTVFNKSGMNFLAVDFLFLTTQQGH